METTEPRTDRIVLMLGLAAWCLAAVIFASNATSMLSDPDVWWHIRSGLDMLRTWRFPVADTWSFTQEGQPWVAKEWLSQVLLALAYKAYGWNGVTLITIASAGFAMALIFREVARHLRPALALLLTVAIAAVCTPVMIARPHVFTFPLLVFFALRLFGHAQRGEGPSFWLLPCITLWANLHGSFTLGFVIAGFAFLEFLETTGARHLRGAVKWIMFGIGCVAAAFVTPYGWTLFQINLDMLQVNETMPLIEEWQPFNAADHPVVKWGLLALFGALLALRQNLSWARIAFALFLLNMMFGHIRFIYPFFLLVPALAAREAGQSLPRLSFAAWASGPRDAFERLALSRFAAPVLLLAAFGVFFATASLRPFSPPANRTIDQALGFIRGNGLASQRVFNGYNLGGVLIFNGIKTFVDGRTEQLFRGKLITDYLNTSEVGGEPLLGELLDRYQVQWTLIHNRDVRNLALSRLAGWSRAYQDGQVTIFRRD